MAAGAGHLTSPVMRSKIWWLRASFGWCSIAVKTVFPLFLVIAALFGVAPLCAEVESAAGSAADGNLHITRYVRPQFPQRLSAQGVTFGEARVAIEVDDKGHLTDCLVTAYSDKTFADSTVAAIRSWLFEPAQTAGKPVGAVAEITMHFRTDGVLVFTTFGQPIDQAAKELVYQPCTPSRLDRQPKPIQIVEPFYPKKSNADGSTATVTLDFYIDEAGRVRVPEVKDASEDFLAATAVAAVKEWRFEPPTSQGRPVLVRATQSFTFVPPAGS